MIKLEEEEQITYIARKHWFIFLGETAVLAIVGIAPALLLFTPAFVVTGINDFLNQSFFDTPHFIFAWSIWLLILWMTFALLWTNYYLDVWILTNHRIIDVEQLGLFNRHTSSFRYDQIQDATVKISGLLDTIIGFGAVEIRTASNETFSFKGVADPDILKQKILTEQHRIHTV